MGFSFVYYTKKYNLSNESDVLKYYASTIIYYLSVIISIWLILEFILVYIIIKFKRSYNTSFTALTLNQNKCLIKLTLTCLFFGVITGIIITFKDMQINDTVVKTPEDFMVNTQNEKDIDNIELEIDKKDKIKKNRFLFEKTIFEIKEQTIILYMLMLGFICLIYLIQKTLLQYLNYTIHYNYYKKRIETNNKHIKSLLKLNKRIKGNIDSDLKKYLIAY
jgi:hypothetical protein